MPKQTFDNLPDEKRQRIEAAAIEEFAEQGFQGASISQIVSQAGIAKGSFYQYFENKRDLFLHLVDLVAQEKTAYFESRQPPQIDLDFFAKLHWMFAVGMEFNLTRPRLNQAVARVLFGDGMIYTEMFEELRQGSAASLRRLIEQGIDRQEIDPAVDPQTAAFVFETLLNNLGLFLLNQQAIDAQTLQTGNIDWLKSERARQINHNVLHILEYGLRRRKQSHQETENEFQVDL